MNKNTLFSVLKYLLSLGLGVGILFFVLKETSIEELKTQVEKIQPIWLVFSAILWLSSHYLRAIRWQMQLKVLNYPVTKGVAYIAVLINYLVNLLIPRAGELARCSVIFRSNHVPLTSIGTVITERILDVLLLAFFMTIGFFLSTEQVSSLIDQVLASGEKKIFVLAALSVIGIVGVGLFWVLKDKLRQFSIYQKVEELIQKLWTAAISIKEVENPILFVIYSLLIWVCYWLATYTLLKSTGLADDAIPNTSLLIFAFTTNLIGAIGVAAPSPGGTGTYHLAIISSFVLFHACPSVQSCSVGISAAFVLHTFQMVFMPIVAGSIAYLILWFYLKKTENN